MGDAQMGSEAVILRALFLCGVTDSSSANLEDKDHVPATTGTRTRERKYERCRAADVYGFRILRAQQNFTARILQSKAQGSGPKRNAHGSQDPDFCPGRSGLA